MTVWLEEPDIPPSAFSLRFRVDKVLHEARTPYQRLVLFENETFGRVLALDDIVQTTERDEFIYHEMIVHVPLFAHGAARSVLIVGGGDGGALEEVVKHRAVERVTMVEIDEGVIAFSKRHLRSICGQAFEDSRLDLKIGDGAEFLAGSSERYDAIIIDSTDPVGPGKALFTAAFYGDCKRSLAPGGVLVTQNGVPFVEKTWLSEPLAALKAVFADVGCYLVAVPSFFGGAMAFGWASDAPALRRVSRATLGARLAESGIKTRHYTPEVHHAAFALPPHLAELVP